MKIIHFLLVIAVLSLFSACKKFDELGDIDRLTYEAEYALPLINTSLSISDVLEEFEDNSTIVIDPDGLIRLIYRGDVFTQSSLDVFASVNESLPELIPVFERRMPLPFSSPDGIQVDQLDLKGGEFGYSFFHLEDTEFDVYITIPQATKDGEPLLVELSLGVADTLYLPEEPINLSGYTIVPENDTVYIEYGAILPSGDTVELPELIPGFGAEMTVTIEDLEFSYAEGFLGVELYDGPRDTIFIDFFESWIQGDVYFEDPVITFYFENSFGIPTRSIVNVFDVFTVRGGVEPLESEYIETGIDFPFPSLSEVGQTKVSAFPIDKTNSNIVEVLSLGPLAIDYDVDALTNPDTLTNIRGFLTDSSSYDVQVEVELPLFGRTFQFEARDTFDANFDDFDEADYAEFKIVSDNGLPLTVEIQGYFETNEGVVLDSLLSDGIDRLVEGAEVDDEGIVIAPFRKETFTLFSEERFENIKSAERIVLRALFSTSNEGEQSVKIFNEQEVDIKIGMILGITEE